MLVLALSSASFGAKQGTRDRSFGKRGTATSYFGKSEQYFDIVQAVGQADRRILVLARVQPKKATRTDANTRQVVVRLHANGALDKSFGTGGIVRDPLGPGITARYAVSMALDKKGRVVVAGTVTDALGKGARVGVARFTNGGDRDPAFAAGSPEFFSFDKGAVAATYSQGSAVSISPDGGVVVGGASSLTGSKIEIGAILKLAESGQRDTQFGENGLIFLESDPSEPAREASVRDVLVREDGSILASGNIDLVWADLPAKPSARHQACLIAKFDAKGVADSQFGSSGQVRLSGHYLSESCDGLAERADGGIFVESHTETGGSKSQPLDKGYSVSAQGLPLAFAGSNFPNVPWKIQVYTASLFSSGTLVNPKGSIYAGFSYNSDKDSRFRAGVIRMKPDGTRDARFSKNGISVLGTGWWQFLPADLARQDAKRVVVVGTSYSTAKEVHALSVKRIWAP